MRGVLLLLTLRAQLSPLFLWVPDETRSKFLRMCDDEGVTPRQMVERWVSARVERFDRRGTEPFEPFELFQISFRNSL